MKKKRIQLIKMLLLYSVFGVLLQTLGLNGIMAGTDDAQDTRSIKEIYIEIQAEHTGLTEVFDIIESKTAFTFSYDRRDVDKPIKFDFYGDRRSLADILLEISQKTSLQFRRINNTIDVKKIRRNNEEQIIEYLQSINVSGTVTSSDEGALPGVNVLVKGTNTGTVTDVNGNYSIEVPDAASVLVFSSIGYLSEEVTVGNQTEINVVMEPDVKSLEEIVVVGYGTQRKRDVTGSVASVSEEEINQVPLSSPEQALQGRVSGVQVRQNGGDLEGNFSVNVRGVASTGNTQPLYVVDGVPLFSGSLSTINSNNIESIEVLKDASATAIYGARASNGVVIISTKTGRPGATNFSIRAQYGLQEATKTIDVMNAQQLADLWRDAHANAGIALPSEFDDPNFPQEDNNWQDLILRTAQRQEYTLDVNGGDEKTQFNISGTYLDREGVLINTGIHRVSLRANIDHQINTKVKIGTRVTGSSQWIEGAVNNSVFGSAFRNALYVRPWVPYRNEDGSYAQIPERSGAFFGIVTNPIANIETEIREFRDNRFLGNTYLEIDLLEHLQFRTSFGADMLFENNYVYLPVLDIGGINARSEGQVNVSGNRQINWVADQTLTYENTFDERHAVKALAGFTAQQFTFNFTNASGFGTTNNNLRELSNQPNITSVGGGGSEAGLVSYFARLNYGYNDTYLLTATVRRDGSSRFGQENQFGTFPSISLGWRLSQETFMKGITWLDDMKVRASYGLTGNQEIGNFLFLARAASANYQWGDEVAEGNAPISFANPELQWEANAQTDIGVDLMFFEGRLSLIADYYRKRSNDLLVSVPVPPTNGITGFQTVNLGIVENRGFEFALNWQNITKNAFTWSTNFNFATNENEVIDIGQDAQGNNLRIPGALIAPPFQQSVNLTTAGQPIGAFYGYVFEGIWQQDEAAAAAEFGVEPGDSRFRDLNGDGRITPDDRQFLGTPHPTYYGGLTNNLSYKNLSLSVFFNWQGGHKLLNTLRMFNESGQPNINQTTAMVNRWTPENPSNTYPRAFRGGRGWDNARPGTRFLEDASFLRLKNVSLTYALGGERMQRIGIRSAKISLSGTNLLTWTGYSGFDPESNSLNSPLSTGQDITPYPLFRMYMLGLELQF